MNKLIVRIAVPLGIIAIFAVIVLMPLSQEAKNIAREESKQIKSTSSETFQQTSQPAMESRCDPSYPDVCIPPWPPDLDCGEISHRNFKVFQPDKHGFDRDKDGIGCESN